MFLENVSAQVTILISSSADNSKRFGKMKSCNLRIIRTNDGCQFSAGWVAVVLNLVIGLGTTYLHQKRSRAY